MTGKVFDDANRNKVQDDGERGLAGVRVVTARGLSAITDAHGRSTSPARSRRRRSRQQLRAQARRPHAAERLSAVNGVGACPGARRGKALKFNFGASIHRVVAIDVADAVFVPGTTEIRPQWQPRLQLLLDELTKAPALLRLSYLADVEDADLVDRRAGLAQADHRIGRR